MYRRYAKFVQKACNSTHLCCVADSVTSEKSSNTNNVVTEISKDSERSLPLCRLKSIMDLDTARNNRMKQTEEICRVHGCQRLNLPHINEWFVQLCSGIVTLGQFVASVCRPTASTLQVSERVRVRVSGRFQRKIY